MTRSAKSSGTVTFERAFATVRTCAMEDNSTSGILVSSAEATIEHTAVRRTSTNHEGLAGNGLTVQVSTYDHGMSDAPGAAVQVDLVGAVVDRHLQTKTVNAHHRQRRVVALRVRRVVIGDAFFRPQRVVRLGGVACASVVRGHT